MIIFIVNLVKKSVEIRHKKYNLITVSEIMYNVALLLLSVNCWCGIVGDHVIGPYFFEGRLNG